MKQDTPGSASQAPTTIARGSKVKGSITGSTPLRVEGELDGRIRSDGPVTVDKSGLVKGEVHADTVQISGKLVGNVTGKSRVEVLAGGSLVGDVTAPAFVIIEGAFYKGQVEMSGSDSSKAAGQAPGKGQG
jgi:cytoskeletal protein CcmA (bactofilin family)